MSIGQEPDTHRDSCSVDQPTQNIPPESIGAEKIERLLMPFILPFTGKVGNRNRLGSTERVGVLHDVPLPSEVLHRDVVHVISTGRLHRKNVPSEPGIPIGIIGYLTIGIVGGEEVCEDRDERQHGNDPESDHPESIPLQAAPGMPPERP